MSGHMLHACGHVLCMKSLFSPSHSPFFAQYEHESLWFGQKPHGMASGSSAIVIEITRIGPNGKNFRDGDDASAAQFAQTSVR